MFNTRFFIYISATIFCFLLIYFLTDADKLQTAMAAHALFTAEKVGKLKHITIEVNSCDS